MQLLAGLALKYLGEAAVQFALGVIKEWLVRSEIKRGERQRLLIESLQLESAALAFAASAGRDPGAAAAVRVRDGAGGLGDFRPVPPDPSRADGGPA